jgi:hypothetical protein
LRPFGADPAAELGTHINPTNEEADLAIDLTLSRRGTFKSTGSADLAADE